MKRLPRNPQLAHRHESLRQWARLLAWAASCGTVLAAIGALLTYAVTR